MLGAKSESLVGAFLPMLLPVAGGRSTVVKFGEFIMILELHRQGLKVAAIARQLGIDRGAVGKYISRGRSRRPMVRGRAGRRAPIHSCRIYANGLPPFLASPRYGCGAK
jgi:hypothetical protein